MGDENIKKVKNIEKMNLKENKREMRNTCGSAYLVK